MKARLARKIRKRSQKRSACRDHMGVSELFTAPPADREVIHNVGDTRCIMWLLGFDDVPQTGSRHPRTA